MKSKGFQVPQPFDSFHSLMAYGRINNVEHFERGLDNNVPITIYFTKLLGVKLEKGGEVFVNGNRKWKRLRS